MLNQITPHTASVLPILFLLTILGQGFARFGIQGNLRPNLILISTVSHVLPEVCVCVFIVKSVMGWRENQSYSL